MSELLKKQTVTVFDEIYTLVSDEPPQRLVHAAGMLNEYIRHVAPVEDKKRAIVLCALQVALECERLKEHVSQIKQKENALATLVDRELAHFSSSISSE